MMESCELTLTVLINPDMANLPGKVPGGALLKLLDQVAYACASRHAAACEQLIISRWWR